MAPRLNICSYLPRRLQIVASLTALVVFCILFLGSSSSSTTVDPYLARVPYGPQIASGAHQVVGSLPKLPHDLPHVSAPHWLNPFSGRAHTPPPPEQANSSSGQTRWYADFKWRNPFSNSITLDESRAVLPPLRERPPVYTYFDASKRRKDDVSKKAEQDLLHIWRRAWWAQGFRPVVLGKAEAMNNPLYRAVQGLELEAELEMEMMRWLAWGHMGTGVLCNWLALPMAGRDDPLLSFLRRGEYPQLMRYEGLDNGLFVGNRDDIDSTLKNAMNANEIKLAKSIMDCVPASAFTVDSEHSGIAFYSTSILSTHYALIKSKLASPSTLPEALALLPPLINSHLHMTWQNTFTSGIAVLKPLPEHTTSLIAPAIDIARNLSQCPDTPIPASCPPNRPKCKPCVARQPLLISTPPVFRNTSTLFTIATLAHPYTLTSLLRQKPIDEFSIPFVRRETARDPWILAATKELLGLGLSSFARLVHVKDAVASDYGSARSLWLTAEHPIDVTNEDDLESLDWLFGFALPRTPLPNGRSETPVPGPERRPPPPKQEFGDGPIPDAEGLKKEKDLLDRGRLAVAKSDRAGNEGIRHMRETVEKWNLADAEVWKFVRAWGARREVEREAWEEEEEGFGKGVMGRWVDKVL